MKPSGEKQEARQAQKMPEQALASEMTRALPEAPAEIAGENASTVEKPVPVSGSFQAVKEKKHLKVDLPLIKERVINTQDKNPQVTEPEKATERSAGFGLRLVGWILIIAGLIMVFSPIWVVGIIFMLLGLLFVIVGIRARSAP